MNGRVQEAHTSRGHVSAKSRPRAVTPNPKSSCLDSKAFLLALDVSGFSKALDGLQADFRRHGHPQLAAASHHLNASSDAWAHCGYRCILRSLRLVTMAWRWANAVPYSAAGIQSVLSMDAVHVCVRRDEHI